MKCENLENNRNACNCTYEPCSRKGKCCECVVYHKGSGELPACFFTKAQEATYDRSIAHFVRVNR